MPCSVGEGGLRVEGGGRRFKKCHLSSSLNYKISSFFLCFQGFVLQFLYIPGAEVIVARAEVVLS